MKIYKTGTFDAAHQLEGHEKCGLLHGHTYKYEVWIEGELDEEFGFVLDFHYIKDYFNKYDHSDKIIKDSCEVLTDKAVEHFFNIGKVIYSVKVRLWETPTAYAEREKKL